MYKFLFTSLSLLILILLGLYSMNSTDIEREQAHLKRYIDDSKQGDPYSTIILANSHQLGRWVHKDIKKSFKLYLQAAESGNALAQSIVSTLYNEGKGVSSDKTKARYWLRLSQKNASMTKSLDTE